MSISTTALERWKAQSSSGTEWRFSPYKTHTVLTDNGMAFAGLPKNRTGPSRLFLGPHIFDRVCIANSIENRLTKP